MEETREKSVFRIETPEFEGPLEILLRMVQERKLFINDFSLSRIADEYIAYIESLEEFPMKDVAEFINIASTLILIKSRSLLPDLELSEEEEASIEDLEERLKTYEFFSELSKYLKERFGMNIIFPSAGEKMRPVFSPDPGVNKESLLEAARSVLENLPEENLIPKVSVKKIVSLEQMMSDLEKRVKKSFKMSLRDFAGDGGSPEERARLVVGFLAVLELARRGVIIVRQNAHFDEIEIENGEVSLPEYR